VTVSSPICCAELSGKSIPIHFVLDDGPVAEASDTSAATKSTRDSYVVVPGNALFTDLVHIVLSRIGFTTVDALAAKGTRLYSHTHSSLFTTRVVETVHKRDKTIHKEIPTKIYTEKLN